MTGGAPSSATAGIRARGLCCRRGGRRLFAPVDFAVAPGESLLLQGPNGAGKSSLLRLLAGLLPQGIGLLETSGRAALADERLALDTDAPLAAALRFWARMDGADEPAQSAAMAALSLTDLAEVPVRMLSTGQRKRAILARTLASGADIWLLDEPGNGLDIASLAALNRAMEAHVARGGLIVAATHFEFAHRFTHRLTLEARPHHEADAFFFDDAADDDEADDWDAPDDALEASGAPRA